MKRSARRSISKHSPKKFRRRLFLFTSFLLLSFIVYIFISNKNIWNGVDRLSLLVVKNDGSVRIGILDPSSKNLTSIKIPANTQITASYELGNWQLGSLWELGENEKLGGKLIASSVTKTFKFPIDAWIGKGGPDITEGDSLNFLKIIFQNYTSNLALRDKLKISLFLLKGGASKRSEIELSDTSYLEKSRLVTGEEGYLVKGSAPTRISKLFAIERISQEGARVGIINALDDNLVLNDMVEIIETLGSKVVSVQEVNSDETDCQIKSTSSLTGEILARIFDCKKLKSEPLGNLDVEIRVGKSFYKRF